MSKPAPRELHITSLVVHSTPRRVQGVSELIAAIPGARVHAASHAGKLVVTLEAGTASEILSQVNGIQRTDGVLSSFMASRLSARWSTSAPTAWRP